MQGKVIGVTYGFAEDGHNLNFAVDLEMINQFLQRPDNPEQLQKAGSYILSKIIFKWVRNIVIGIVALPIAISFLLYILVGWYRFVASLFRRRKIPVVAVPKEELFQSVVLTGNELESQKTEQYQPVVLSSNKSERQWRSR